MSVRVLSVKLAWQLDPETHAHPNTAPRHGALPRPSRLNRYIYPTLAGRSDMVARPIHTREHRVNAGAEGERGPTKHQRIRGEAEMINAIGNFIYQ